MKCQFMMVAFCMIGTISLTSCFKDEPLNAECDIEQAYIHADEPDKWFESASDTLVNVQSDQTKIVFTMRGDADLTHLAPQFRITPGATIFPESGSVQDFSQGEVVYTVMSEDKKWTRTYFVSVKGLTKFGKEHDFDFENAYIDRGYYNWNEPWTNEYGKTTQLGIWATGNPGFKISNSSTAALDYPTTIEENGYDGKAVKLTTRRTSKLADMVKKPIAAGNLFIGQFDPQNALQDAMKATKFGRPFSFDSKPLTFSGMYKYQPGTTFTDKNMNVLDQQDYATIYAVLYDNHDEKGNAVVLYGDNVQTSPQVVALARLDNIGSTPEWTPFLLNFIYKKEVDAQKLKNGGYSLTIVGSSSTNGAEFMGAVGSTLWIDQFKVKCE